MFVSLFHLLRRLHAHLIFGCSLSAAQIVATALRDSLMHEELLYQLCKQTTQNPSPDVAVRVCALRQFLGLWREITVGDPHTAPVPPHSLQGVLMLKIVTGCIAPPQHMAQMLTHFLTPTKEDSMDLVRAKTGTGALLAAVMALSPRFENGYRRAHPPTIMEFVAAFNDETIKCVFCFQGGGG